MVKRKSPTKRRKRRRRRPLRELSVKELLRRFFKLERMDWNLGTKIARMKFGMAREKLMKRRRDLNTEYLKVIKELESREKGKHIVKRLTT